MIRLTDTLWIGDSTDEQTANLGIAGIGAILNVAQDLQATRGWKNGVEYMQVGLIDGPGNPLTAYYAAVLALTSILNNGSVLVCCHTGGRALAVAMMYLNATVDRSWNDWLRLLSERTDVELESPNDAHKEAFECVNWRWLVRMVGQEVKK